MSIKNNEGFTLIGILIVVIIIAGLAYGSSSYFKKDKNNEAIKQGVDRQLDEIQQNNLKLNQIKMKALDGINKQATSTE